MGIGRPSKSPRFSCMRELMQLNVGACTAERAEIRAIRKRNGRPKVGRAAAGRAARAENPRNYCLKAQEAKRAQESPVCGSAKQHPNQAHDGLAGRAPERGALLSLSAHHDVTIYSDGFCMEPGSPGGWAFVL